MRRGRAADNVATALIAGRMKRNIPLAPFTTLKIGGPADMLIETFCAEDLAETIASARASRVPVTVLGEGSNVLISDDGVKGLVIINRSSRKPFINDAVEENQPFSGERPHTPPRWHPDAHLGTFKYEFRDLDYDESAAPKVEVEIESGASLPRTIHELFGQRITGLQWFSGIPGTVGGALVNNIHGGTHFFFEFVKSVKVLTEQGIRQELTPEELLPEYNSTLFHEHNFFILSATLSLRRGDVNKARHTAAEWARRKAIQPRNSPGCAFSNISSDEQKRLGLPTNSVGYLIEHILNMSDYRVGDAAISRTHHNFIVNEGKATADDYIELMKEIRSRAKEMCGLSLIPEIFFLGFSEDPVVS